MSTLQSALASLPAHLKPRLRTYPSNITQNPNGSYVLYYLRAGLSLRAHENPALDCAVHAANVLKKPLVVLIHVEDGYELGHCFFDFKFCSAFINSEIQFIQIFFFNFNQVKCKFMIYHNCIIQNPNVMVLFSRLIPKPQPRNRPAAVFPSAGSAGGPARFAIEIWGEGRSGLLRCG